MTKIQRWTTSKKIINNFKNKKLNNEVILIGKKKQLDESLIGQKFGKLTIIDFTLAERNRQKYICECECGTVIIVDPNKLHNGKSKSCGCAKTNAYEKYKNYIGQKINKWTVINLVPPNDKNKVWFAKCICECGTEKNINIYNLINGSSKDCGCGRKQKLRKTKTKEIIGQRYGKLTVINLLEESDKFKRRQYKCRCDCGNEIIVSSICLISNHTHSCGCLSSYPNMCINKYLDEINILHETEHTVDYAGHKFRFDFYLPDYNLMIEYDGEGHYKPIKYGGITDEEAERKLNKRQYYDQLKNEYCELNNINLLRIPYWNRENIYEIIDNYLQRLSGNGFAA